MEEVKEEGVMHCEEASGSGTEQKPSISEKGLEGHVHLGDAGLEDEDEEMEEEEQEDDEEGDESEGDEVESIEDIKLQNGIFKYRVRWVGCKPSEDTWEPEESFTGSESKLLLQQFREAHKDKVEELLRADKARRSRRTKRAPRWEYVSEIVTREDSNSLKPRELQEDDVFYGQTAGEISSAPSELKKLFDPTHKNSVTELFLTKTDPTVKVTRSQTKALIQSREASRSNTPISTKLLTAEDTSRGSASPTPQPQPQPQPAKGRQRKTKAPKTTRASKRKAEEQEVDEAPETVVVETNQATATTPPDKPPIVLKLTLKKADKPAKKGKRSASEKLPKPRRKREKSSPDSVNDIAPAESKEDSEATSKDTDVSDVRTEQPPSDTLKESEATPSRDKKEIKPKSPSTALAKTSSLPVAEGKKKVSPVTSTKPNSSTNFETKTKMSPSSGAKPKSSPAVAEKSEPPSQVLPVQKGRRRALDLLPGSVTTNEPLTSQVLNNMLRDLEIKYYGDDEKHPYTQEQFNDAIMSGNFMRVRKAMVNNVLTAPRLALWTNSYGANLLHLLCRSTKCDGGHAGDDIATVLCNIAPSLLAGRDCVGRIPLHDAVERGQVCRVIRLLTYHSPVNVIDRRGNTALSLAYIKNHAKMVKVLLQAGASFHALESCERRKSENQRKRRAFDMLTKHSRIVTGLMFRARRKVCRLMTEVRLDSPPFTAPFADGPEFTFDFYHTPAPPPDGGQYAQFLFLHVCSVKSEGGLWQVRCWGGLRLAQAPLHNGRPLEPTSHTDRGDHMIFFITLVNGANKIQIRLSEAEVSRKVTLGVQVVLLKRNVRENWSSSQNHYPPLEHTPMVGPM